MPTCAEEIAQFVENISFNDLSLNTKNRAKLLTLDLLGVALAARNEPAVLSSINYIKELNAAGRSSIYGYKKRMIAANAAFVNGIMGHCYDYDDLHKESIVHPGVISVPSCLAVCENVDGSGKDYLGALVLAYEIAIRVAMAARAGVFHERGFHPTGVAGVFGSTVGASKLLKLTRTNISNALGIAGSQASSLFEFQADGSWTKRFNAGWACQSGVVAAFLAKEGFSGPHSVFEGKQGFYRAYVGEGNYNISELTKDLGKIYQIDRTSVKLYPCCQYNQTVIEAAKEIKQKYNIRADEVQQIEIRTFKELIPIVAEPLERKLKPLSRVDAQFSIYYAFASGFLRGSATLKDFSEDRINDQEVLKLASKIKVVVDPDIQAMYPAYYATSVIVKVDKEKYQCTVKSDKGSAELIRENEIINKFRDNLKVQEIYGDKYCDEIINKVLSLDMINNIDELTVLLRKRGK